MASLDQNVVIVPSLNAPDIEKDEEGMSDEEDDRIQMPLSLSIWSTSNGLTPLGSIHLKSNIVSSLRIANDASIIKWHSSGNQVCVIAAGEVVLLNTVWRLPNNEQITYTKVALRDNDGENEEDVALFPRCELSIKSRKMLEASSLCLCSSGTCLLVGCDRGMYPRITTLYSH